MLYYETDEVNLQVFPQFKDLQGTVYCLGFIVSHSKYFLLFMLQNYGNWIIFSYSLCIKILILFFRVTIFKPPHFLIQHM